MLRKWHLKWAAQSVLSRLPGGVALNAAWAGRRALRDFPQMEFEQGLHQIALLRAAGGDVRGARVLEYGAGRVPVVPLLYALAGARSVQLVDLDPLLRIEHWRATLAHLRPRAEEIAAALGADAASIGRFLSDPGEVPLSDALASRNFRYDAPLDVRSTPWAEYTVDIVTTRTVLEHIPESDLAAIHRECHRLLVPGGFMVHTIDTSDHFQHFNRTLPRLNFLRYSPAQMRRWNNRLLFQNRLRASRHVELQREAGFDVVTVDAMPNARAIEQLRAIPVHADFSGYEPEELARLTVHTVARRPNT